MVISSENSDETARIAAQLGMPGIAADVTDDAALARLVDGTRGKCGGVDLLICNAGISGRPARSRQSTWPITTG